MRRRNEKTEHKKNEAWLYSNSEKRETLQVMTEGKGTKKGKKSVECWLEFPKDEHQAENQGDRIFNHYRKRHKKVFFFIVDALRLDFMVVKRNSDEDDKKDTHEKRNNNHQKKDNNGTSTLSSASPSSSSHPFSDHSPYNRLTNMHRLLRRNASQTALFGFRADPPTVTSQRLKGLYRCLSLLIIAHRCSSLLIIAHLP